MVIISTSLLFQNQLQVNARLLQQHIATTTGKLIPLKDIHNIRAHSAKVGTDEWEATLQELEKLQTQDPRAVVEVLVRDNSNELEMIILQSGEMLDNLQKFPEVIQLDGTYGLNIWVLPLYAVVVEDANGHGQLGAIIITKGETVTSLQTMIERVKASNPSLENTQVVVIDKYFAEVQGGDKAGSTANPVVPVSCSKGN